MTFDFIILKNFRALNGYHLSDRQSSSENASLDFQKAVLKGNLSPKIPSWTHNFQMKPNIFFRSVNGIQIKTLQDEYGRFKVNNIGIYSDFAKP